MIPQDEAETVMWQGRFITGKTRGKWEYVSRARGIKAAVILAMEDDHVLLVEQYRVPLGANCIELPAGLIGDHEEGEDTLMSAARELEEETGLTQFDVRAITTGPAFVHVTDRDGEQPHRHWNIGWLYIADLDAPLSIAEGARWFGCSDLPEGPPDLVGSVALLRPLVLR